jgi:hypothetical protein
MTVRSTDVYLKCIYVKEIKNKITKKKKRISCYVRKYNYISASELLKNGKQLPQSICSVYLLVNSQEFGTRSANLLFPPSVYDPPLPKYLPVNVNPLNSAFYYN